MLNVKIQQIFKNSKVLNDFKPSTPVGKTISTSVIRGTISL